MEANMKRKLLLCMGAMLLAGTLAAQEIGRAHV